MRTPSPPPQAGFASKAKDLQALREAVVEAATVSGPLWVSYLFVFFYLAIAAGGVTHRDLFFENPVKLPFLNVDLPLIGFFSLGPLLFLIVHAYTLLHFALLAGKVGAFDEGLQEQIGYEEVQEGLRRQLPSNIFVQFLAGPLEVRSHVMGWMLRLIAWISLIIGPIVLLVFFQLQFLPYHHEGISLLQRFSVFFDLILLWMLWPLIAGATTIGLRWRDFLRPKIATLFALSTLPVLLVFTIATFPGEWLDENLPPMPFVAAEWRPHSLLVEGAADDVARRPKSLWSNRLVVPGIDVVDRTKLDSEAKIAAAPLTVSLRGRRLEGAVLSGAVLRKADFTGAQLMGAVLREADLRDAKFECGDAGSDHKCADIRGGSFYRAKLQGASLIEAQLQGASFTQAQLQGVSLVHAQLQGASLYCAELQGASLWGAQLQGAELDCARLQGASLIEAKLQGASLDGSDLQGARLGYADLQGASLNGTDLQGASLDNVFVWRADGKNTRAASARITEFETAPKYRALQTTSKYLDCPGLRTCDWSAHAFAELKRLVEAQVPAGELRDNALARIARLDPDRKVEWQPDLWVGLARSSPQQQDYHKFLAAILQKIGCSDRSPPYAIRGLLGWLEVFDLDPSQRGVLVTAFLDEAHCPGAHGLSDKDKWELQSIRYNNAALSSPAPATP